MDPDETLAQLRALAKDTLSGEYATGDEPAFELAELLTSLDEWLSRGGFLPNAWEAGRS